MAGWAGFSDEELRRLQQKDQAVPAALGRTRKPAQANRNRQQRERALRVAAQQDVVPGAPALTPGQQLSKGPPEHRPPPPPAPPAEKIKEGDPSVNHQIPRAEEPLPIVKELEKQEVEIREKTRLELLQQEQKMIEERNKRKKALLTKTIAEKSKQTQEEAVKLKRIQKELQVLDDMVSNDIGILRCRIEQASWDYSAARKRYEKAETEYVTAKLDLHKKTEIKEQLTEHLCAIIQQNELRKAHKLEELMQQLQLQVTEEELDEARQRMEEEEKEKAEEKKRRDILEDGEEGTEVRENGEAAVPSTRDRPSTAGENVKDQTAPPAPETKGTTKDCDVVENTPQNQAVTFVS